MNYKIKEFPHFKVEKMMSL